MSSARSRVRDAVLRSRAYIPASAVPTLVRRRVDKLWKDPAYRANCEQQMQFLLDASPRADEANDLARAYAEHMVGRAYWRWQTKTITNQEIRGIEWISSKRDLDRALVISFMHHNQYDGIWASIALRHGESVQGIMTPEWMAPDAPADIQQHRKLCEMGTTLYPAAGAKFMIDNYLKPGDRFVIAPDIPGNTPVTFLGKQVLGSFGSARMAAMVDAPIAVVTSHREGDGHYVQIHEPLEPKDYGSPAELNQATLDIHSEAVLAWPEALEAPTARFGRIEPEPG